MYITLIMLSLYFNSYHILYIFRSSKYTQSAVSHRNWFAKKRLILQLRMAIKGQFAPFDTRLDTVNKHLQLETVEKNFADKEKKTFQNPGRNPRSEWVHPHFVRFQTQLTKPLTQPQRESVFGMRAHSVMLDESTLGIPSSAPQEVAAPLSAHLQAPSSQQWQEKAQDSHLLQHSSSTGPDPVTGLGGFFLGFL